MRTWRRVFGAIIGCALIGAAIFYVLTIPRGLSARAIASVPEGDAERGEQWFLIGGCASCHADPKAVGDDKLRLGGGLVLETEFGDFVAPNVSMHPQDGIGSWSLTDFATALKRGVSPNGRHYYPALPYASYTRMELSDISDLWAYWQTLPAVEGVPPPNDLAFPFSFRRGLGLWKLAFLRDGPIVNIDVTDPALVRGQYLVEGAGHCGECHTPRGLGGAMDYGLWLSGAPSPDGPGRIPNISSGEGGIGDWPVSDIAYYFETGFTPSFEIVGGSMVSVQDNLSRIAAEDREAIAAYLKAVPPHATTR